VAKSFESEAKLKSLDKIDDTDIILDIGKNTVNKIYNINNNTLKRLYHWMTKQ